ncbi:hypothetical protein PT974_11151 [Cladobotryum mycophilum]|uniref:MYND-type domain-containing protein n=1 Tax=Cladobotryum mycophilum TaxID=491253 RepID=A0ABR0S5E9_9HYPO
MSSTSPSLKGQACEVCQKKVGLLRCSGCKVVCYCRQEHQISDRARHKEGCVAVRRALRQADKEETALRNLPADMFTPDNIFETGVGRFWGIHETRPYMRARLGVVDTTLEYFAPAGGYAKAVQIALDHLVDMIRLSRSDNMGVRSQIPALYIRLGRDQEAYDFMKWYATSGRNPRYNWGNMDLPFLDVKDANFLESVGAWANRDFLDVSHSIAVTLIKVRVLLDLQTLQNATRAFQETMTQEIIDTIRDQMPGSIVKSHSHLVRSTPEELSHHIETVKAQIKELYQAVTLSNPHYWPAMLNNPAATMADRPSMYSLGSKEEAYLTVGYNWPAWAETPGAIDVIRNLRKVGSF